MLCLFASSSAQNYQNYYNNYQQDPYDYKYMDHSHYQDPRNSSLPYQSNNGYAEYYNQEYYGDYRNDPHLNHHYHQGTNPQTFDWDFRESWRDNRKAFFSGETQAEAYRKAHPPGTGGIGYDPDPVYQRLRMKIKEMDDEMESSTNQNKTSCRSCQ